MRSSRIPMCNNDPDSAPVVYGKTFFLCWRCTGAFVGLMLILLLNLIIVIPSSVLLKLKVFIIPSIIDYCLNKFRVKKPNNILRFITGVLLGMAVGAYEILVTVMINRLV